MSRGVCESFVDGLYYPQNPQALGDQVAALLADSVPAARPGGGALQGLVTPHGAWAQTGRFLAPAYRALQGEAPEAETVLILAPLHRGPEDCLALPPFDAFRTPLGEVEVNREWRDRLLELPGFCEDEGVWQEEPGVECQLPFLQRLLPSSRILPLYYGETGTAARRLLIRGLARLLSAGVFSIITTNLSAYLPGEQSLAQAEAFFLGPLRQRPGPGGFDPGAGPSVPAPCGWPALAGWYRAFEETRRDRRLEPPEFCLENWGTDDPESGEIRRIYYGSLTLWAVGI